LKRRRIVAAAALCFGMTACSPSNVYLSGHYTAARKVAVLPIANNTMDLDGPPFIRQLIFDHLSSEGFDLVPLADVDARLKDQGFTDGGQLGAATPEKLGEWTGADTLFYPTLEEFNYILLGFYSQRHVQVNARVMDAKTGERLWEAERDCSTRFFAPNKEQAKRQFAVQLAVKAAEKLAHVPLQAESRVAVDRLLATLPHR
jgi:hypothetical protein